MLYNNYGPYYVGLTRDNLGDRLKNHIEDKHADRWSRFSWFGFANVLKDTDEKGFQRLKPLKLTLGTPDEAIGDIEALLIHAIGPRNTNKMSFQRAEEWLQIKLDELDTYLPKVAP